MANEFDPFKKKIEDALNKFASADNMQKIGDLAAGIIKKRTRLGFGVETTGADRNKLKPLSEKYIEFRKNLKGIQRAKKAVRAGGKVSLKTKQRASKNPKIELSSDTSASKSNLTLTGQMLDSLKATSTQGSVTIEASGNRKDGLSNKEISGYVEEQGRKFLDLAKADLKQIKNYLESLVDKLLK